MMILSARKMAVGIIISAIFDAIMANSRAMVYVEVLMLAAWENARLYSELVLGYMLCEEDEERN